MKNPIPFFNLSAQWELIKDEVKAAVNTVLDSGYFVGGPSVAQFEQDLASFLGSKHVVSCNSGTDALWLSLKALDVKPGDIVLTTPFSFIASSSEIHAHGAHPVFVDIERDTLNISPEAIERWLREHTMTQDGKIIHVATCKPVVGILTVNIFGQCADYEKISRLAKERGLWIVEDGAQSIGSEINGRQASTFGDIGTFSFYPTKNLGACGDAGATVTDNPELADKLLKLRNHGRLSRYEYLGHGINSRMDAIQAAALSVKLRHLPSFTAKRQAHAATYNNILSKVPSLMLPLEKVGTHTYHQYCVRVPQIEGRNLRDELIAYLTEQKIGTNIFYPTTFHHIPFLNAEPELINPCPVAEAATQTIVALPIFPELTEEQVTTIANHIMTFMAQQGDMTACMQSKAKPQQQVS